MEGRAADADPTQGEPHENSMAGGEVKKAGKGKEREATFADRLHASGRMALDAVITAQPPLASPSNGKASTSLSSPNQNQGSTSESAVSEASRRHGTPHLGDSLRNHPHIFGQASAQYDQFLDTAPQLRDSFQPALQSGEPVQSPSFREQTSADGAGVIQLLAMPEEEPSYSDFDELLSEHEAARLREAFFTNSTSQPAWNRLLSFTPKFLLDPRGSHEARAHMGTEDTMVAHDAWLQQWHDVLNSYTDEVWGDLGSLVNEAKREIETITSHTDIRSPESKALDRLRQILVHVRGQI